MSLRTRLTVGTALALALAICAGLAAAYVVVRGQLVGEIDKSLKERSTSFATLDRQVVDPPPPPPGDIRLRPAKLGGAAGYVQFVERGGKVTLPPGESTRLPTDGAADVATGRRPSLLPRRHRRRHASPDLHRTARREPTAAQIARPLSEVDNVLSRSASSSCSSRSSPSAERPPLGPAVARTTLWPVRRLTQDAERIASTGNLRERTDERRSTSSGGSPAPSTRCSTPSRGR